ncbi:MAG TPA: ABC transporter permease [Xanthomonadales bacterium]|nr:ABC transporter permease [Xanthomonadales bacterium]
MILPWRQALRRVRWRSLPMQVVAVAAFAAIAQVMFALVVAPLPGSALDGRWGLLRLASPANPGGQLDRESLRQVVELPWLTGGVAWAAAGVEGEVVRVPQRLQVAAADHAYLARVQPFLGRVPQAGAAPPEAMVSHALWLRSGGDPALVGATMKLGEREFVVTGVASPAFHGLLRDVIDDAWIADSETERTFTPAFPPDVAAEVPALHLAVPPSAVAHERDHHGLRGIVPRTQSRFVDATDRAFTLTQGLFLDLGRGQAVANATRLALAGALLFLLVCCVNAIAAVAVRLPAERRSVAVEVALGATRGHLVRRVFAEAAITAAVVTVLATVLAVGAALLLRRHSLLAGANIGDAFAAIAPLAALALAASVLLNGAVALFRAVSLASVAETEIYAATRAVRVRTLAAIVAIQLAIAIALAGFAASFAAQLAQLRSAPLGFDAAQLVFAKVRPADPESRRLQVTEASAARDALALAALDARYPKRVAVVADVPFEATPFMLTVSEPGGTRRVAIHMEHASAGWFDVAGTRMLQGRAFGAGETGKAVVTRAAARAVFGSEDVIGRRFLKDEMGDEVEIVGVAEDVRSRSPAADPVPTVYVSNAEFGITGNIVFRGFDAVAARRLAEELIAGREPARRIAQVESLADRAEDTLASERQRRSIALGAAFAALLLALAGVGAMLTAFVADTKDQVGIRVALGARWSHLARYLLELYATALVVGSAAAAVLYWTSSPLVALEMPGAQRAAWLIVAILAVGSVGVLAFVRPLVTLRRLAVAAQLNMR